MSPLLLREDPYEFVEERPLVVVRKDDEEDEKRTKPAPVVTPTP